MLSKVCVCPQLYPTLCNTIDYSLPGSSVYGIFQARIPKWVAISYASGSSRCRDQPASLVSSALMGRFLTTASPGKPTCQRQVLFYSHFTEWESKMGSSKKLTQGYKSRSDRTWGQTQGLWLWTSVWVSISRPRWKQTQAGWMTKSKLSSPTSSLEEEDSQGPPTLCPCSSQEGPLAPLAEAHPSNLE